MQIGEIVVSFVSTLLGVLLGIPVALLLDRKMGERKKREKAICVLTSLKEEINHNIALLGQIQTQLLPNTMIFFNLDMNVWRATSIEEFEGTISHSLRREIFSIYYEYEHLSRKVDTQFNMHYNAARTIQNYGEERRRIVQAINEHARTLTLQSQTSVTNIELEITTLEQKNKSRVSSKKPWITLFTIIFSWLIVLALVETNYFSNIFDSKIKSFSIYGFMVIVPLLSARYIEKRSITEKFGFERRPLLGMVSFIFISLSILFYFDLYDFGAVFFAPLTEELFFRGYMLGFFSESNHKDLKNILIDSWWILYTSILFGLSHLFVDGYSITSMLLTTIGGISLGTLYIRFKTVFWCFAAHMLYNLAFAMGIGDIAFVFLVMIPIIITISGLINWKNDKKTN